MKHTVFWIFQILCCIGVRMTTLLSSRYLWVKGQAMSDVWTKCGWFAGCHVLWLACFSSKVHKDTKATFSLLTSAKSQTWQTWWPLLSSTTSFLCAVPAGFKCAATHMKQDWMASCHTAWKKSKTFLDALHFFFNLASILKYSSSSRRFKSCPMTWTRTLLSKIVVFLMSLANLLVMRCFLSCTQQLGRHPNLSKCLGKWTIQWNFGWHQACQLHFPNAAWTARTAFLSKVGVTLPWGTDCNSSSRSTTASSALHASKHFPLFTTTTWTK